MRATTTPTRLGTALRVALLTALLLLTVTACEPVGAVTYDERERRDVAADGVPGTLHEATLPSGARCVVWVRGSAATAGALACDWP